MFSGDCKCYLEGGPLARHCYLHHFMDVADVLSSGTLAKGGTVSGNIYFAGALSKALYFDNMLSKTAAASWALS